MNVLQRINEWALFQLFKTGALNLETERFNNISDEFCARIIKHQPEAIQFMKNQNEELQWLAIETAFGTREIVTIEDTLLALQDPTEKIQMQIIQQDTMFLNFIKHPTEKIQNFVLDLGEKELFYNLNEVSDKVSLRAITEYGFIPNDLNKCSKEVQDRVKEIFKSDREDVVTEQVRVKIIRKDPEKIKFVKNQNEELQWLAMETAYKSRNREIIDRTFENLKDPGENVLLKLIEKETSYIQAIEHPTEKIQNFVLDLGSEKLFKQLNQVSTNVALRAITEYGFIPNDLNKCSKEVQESAIEKKPISVMNIVSPSEDLQLLAIRSVRSETSLKDGQWSDNEFCVINNILSKNPTDKVQMEIIKEDLCEWVKLIKKPCVELQNYILENHLYLYQELKDVHDDVIAKGLKEHDIVPYINFEPPIYDCDDPEFSSNNNYGEELKAYEKKCDELIETVINKSEILKNAAIEGNPYKIQYIKDPSIDLQLKAVKANGLSIEVIKNPADIVQKEALKNNINSALVIDRLTDENARFVLQKSGFPENKIDDLKALPAVAKIFVSELNNKQDSIENIVEKLHQKYKVEHSVKNKLALNI